MFSAFNKYIDIDSKPLSSKIALFSTLFLFAAIPVTVIALFGIRTFSSKAALSPAYLSPNYLINTLTPSFSWKCFCQPAGSLFRIYIREKDGNFNQGSWYKDVYVSNFAGEAKTSWGNWRNYRNTGPLTQLKPLTSYYWEVVCPYGGCETATSVFKVDGVAPTPPYLSLATQNSSSINLVWTSSSDNSNTISRYKLTRFDTTRNTGVTFETVGLTYSDTSFEGVVKYVYIVKAYDEAGNASEGSNPLSIISLDRDSDLDSFNDSVERYVGTNVFVACGKSAWPPDFNNDKKVDATDQQLQATAFNTSKARFDLNKDGIVNSLDLQTTARYLGKGC